MLPRFALLFLTLAIASLVSFYTLVDSSSSLSTALYHPVLFFSGPTHRYFPNKHHSRCEELVSIPGVYAEINSKSKTIFTTGLEDIPSMIITFVLPNIKTSDFLRFGDAFSDGAASSSPAALANLKTWSNSDAWSQLSFGDCHLSQKAIFGGNEHIDEAEESEAARAASHAVVSLQGKAHLEQELQRLSSLEKLPETSQSQRQIVAVFSDYAFVDPTASSEEVRASLTEADKIMGKIIEQVNRLTLGNFVVTVTGQLNQEQQTAGRRELLSTAGAAAATVLTGASPTWNISMPDPTPTELYLDANWLMGIFLSIMVFFFLYIAFSLVHGIQTAPHIADAFAVEEQAKKNQ